MKEVLRELTGIFVVVLISLAIAFVFCQHARSAPVPLTVEQREQSAERWIDAELKKQYMQRYATSVSSTEIKPYKHVTPPHFIITNRSTFDSEPPDHKTYFAIRKDWLTNRAKADLLAVPLKIYRIN